MKTYLRYISLTIILLLLSFSIMAQHFEEIWITLGEGNPQKWMSVVIDDASIDGSGLEAGDEVAVFDVNGDGDEICVGVIISATGIPPYEFSAGQDEPGGPQAGYIEGHAIIYRFWDSSESQEITLMSPTYYEGSDEVYTEGGFAGLSDLDGLSFTWTGTTDDDWNDASNWNSAVVPNDLAYVKIPVSPSGGNFPTLSAAGECENLQLKATSTGIASLMDDGFLTVNGKATVETYLTNAGPAGDFRIHIIGPTVDEENYTGTGTGAFLSAFNLVDGDTYAYEYDEPTGTWPALTSLTDEIQTCKGIALSTTDATAHTLSMTGDLMTGAISSSTLSFGGTSYEMISNPYPSAIDFDALATANSSVVNSKYWIWDPVAGNYVIRVGTSGGSQYIQVGQGFFVETISSGTFDFTNAERTHNNTPFLKNEQINVLTVNVEGGEYGFKDEMIVRFAEEATPEYDYQIEAKKWYSMYDDATMIYCIAEDDTELAINVLPVETLGIENISVPVNFHCGYEDEYTLHFSGVETFDNNEIWLEDKKTGGDWIDLNQNPEYTFVGLPDDQNDRFEIHFYGPTGIIGNSASNSFQIYSSGQNVYVINNSKETIDKIQVYNLTGKLMMEERKLSQRANKLTVDAKSGYYIVKVVTQISSYSNKVMIAIN